MSQQDQYDVIIIGCGPTGAVLANLLGELACRVLVLERDEEVSPIPRATHIDEETVRNLQATGLLGKIGAHYSPFGEVDFVDESRRVIFRVEIKEEGSLHGHTGSQFFYQPGLERVLREGLTRYPGVSLKTGVRVERIQQREGGVLVFAKTSQGAMAAFEARWVVGCDGGQSLARESIQASMRSLSTPNRWFIVDAILKNEKDAALLPSNFRYFFEERLSLYAHGFGLNRRWEFQLGADEEMTPEVALSLVAKHIPLERLAITRTTAYTHRSLVADQWRVGRVLLAGDAAHMMPPFAGQGMCSGIRDAINLAWKLHRVLRGEADVSLIDTYEKERRAHIYEMTQGVQFISALLSGNSLLQRLRRRFTFWMLRRVPGVKARVQQRSMRKIPLRGGLSDESRWGGRHLPQFTIQRTNHPQRLDDVFGYQFTLIAKDFTLTTKQLEWINQREIFLYRPDSQYGKRDLWDWMSQEGLDYVLVRPDKIIASAGSMERFGQCERLFERYLPR